MEPRPQAESFCIPKHEMAARVKLPGQPPALVRIFLGASAARHSGFERPADVFNGANPFVPAKDPQGRVILLQRDAVMVVSFEPSDEPQEDPRPEELVAEQATHETIEVILEDGTRLSGTVTYLLPQASRRLQDFLNTADRFFELRTADDIHLVNKRRVARVSLIHSPRE